ncbi:MAG TPA: hypothetical protein VIN59_03275 [Alphaproteobacteria bacterium]
MTQDTAKTAASATESTTLSTDQSPKVTKLVANDAAEKSETIGTPTITFSGTPGNRRIRVEGVSADASFNPDAAPSDNVEADDDDSNPLTEALEDELAILRRGLPDVGLPNLKTGFGFKALKYGAFAATALWLSGCAGYAFNLASSEVLLTAPDFAALVAGALTPVALFWLVVGQVLRGAEVKLYAHALRSELQAIIFPSEERADAVNKDIERLTQQAAELAVASKAALKAVHRARHGLRTEMREFATLTKKAEVHIQSLTGSLENRSTALLSLTDEIEARVSTIDEKSRAGADAWDNATLSILDRAGEIESAMGKGAEKIHQAAERAQEKAKSIAKTMEGSSDGLVGSVQTMADRLAEISGDFQGHTSVLTNVVSDVTREAARLGQMIDDQLENMQDMTARTVELMNASVADLEAQRSGLDTGAAELAARAKDIASAVSGSVTMIEQAAETVTSKTDGIEERLQRQAAILEGTIAGISTHADRIEEVGRSAAHVLSEAVDSAVNGAGRIGDAIRRGVESLNNATAEAKERSDTLIETTRNHIDRLNEAGAGNVENVKEMVNLLEQSRAQIEAAAELADDQVLKLTQAVDDQAEKIGVSTTSLAERITAVSRAMEEPLRTITIAIADADGRHEQIQTTLTRRVADLQEASEKATESAENIRAILRGQAQEISALSGQVAGNARTINEQMAVQRDDLKQTVIESLEKIKSVRDDLDSTAKRLKMVSEEASVNVTDLQDVVTATTDLLTENAKQAMLSISDLDNDFDFKSKQLVLRAEDATKSINTVCKSLEDTVGTFTPLFDDVMTQTGDMQSSLDKLRNGFADTASSNLDKLKQIGVLFDDRLAKLQEGSTQAANLLKGSSDHLRERVDDIEGAARSASDKMRSISSSMERQSSDIHILTDQTLLKVEGVQKAINDQFHELSEAVGQALAQMQDAGLEFVRRADDVSGAAERVVGKFDVAGTKAKEESARLNDAATKSVQLAENVVAKVQTQSELMLKQTMEALSDLRGIGESFSIKAKEVSSQMKSSLDTSKSYGQEMRAQVVAMADASSKTADEIARSTAQLQARIADVGKSAEGIVRKVEGSGDQLVTQSETLVSAANKAVLSADEAAQSFAKQAQALARVSKEALENAEAIRAAEIRAQRETFLSSARFIMESLHSLSVDFVRMLDGEVPEKLWKSYQKGDLNVFTQRLVEALDKVPVDKVREKFASDSEFRNYVQRYIRQYEEVFDQAMDTDRGDLLGSTFMASDIGKLYRFLCHAAGRDPRGVEAKVKAA